METHAQNEQDVSSIYTGAMPVAADQGAVLPEEANTEENDKESHKKKYHSSAMYAASVWHNTVSHVRANSHKAQDM